jgi:hypothetical protein
MPRSNITAAMIAELTRQGGLGLQVLADIQTIDGTNYFFATHDDIYPLRIAALLDPNAFDTTSWTKAGGNYIGGAAPAGPTVTPNNQTDPLGGATADTIDYPATAANQYSDLGQFVLNVLQLVPRQFVFEVWLKAAANTTITLIIADSGPFTGIGTGTQVVNITNQWQLFRVAANFTAGVGPNIFLTIRNDQSQGAKTIYAWGAKLSAQYSPWIKRAGPFRRTRDFRTDAGDLVLQNLSGNTVQRDLSKEIVTREFEGALCIVRLWSPLLQDIADEFHGYLSEQSAPEDEFSLRMLQLFDPAQYDIAEDLITDTCSFRYKSAQCGSTGSAGSCSKRFSDCIDATRAASERFDGVLNPAPGPTVWPVQVDTGTGLRNRGNDDGDNPAEMRRGGTRYMLEMA